MWDKIKRFLAQPVFADHEDNTRAAALLNPLVLSLFVVDVFGVVVTVFVFEQKLGGSIVVGLLFLTSLISKLLLQRGHVRAGGIVFVAGVWFPISAVMVLAAGRHLIGVTYVALTVVAGLIIGQGAAIALAIVSSLFYLAIVIVDAAGIALPVFFPDLLMSNWVVLSLALALTVVPLSLALRNLNAALNRARRYAAESEQQRQQIETLAEDRTLELNRRTNYLNAATQIAAEIAVVERDLRTLLQRATEVISQQFGFYHTGIFLPDEDKRWIVLQAASSEGGQRMLQRHHRLRIGAEGIVGAVAAYGQHRIAQNVGADAVYFDNPDLPDTRSEVALPLRARGEIIGVLDVQSTAPAAFSDEDVSVLQALADQVSVAVSNARLLRQVEERIAAERRAYGQLAHEAWREVLGAHTDLAFASDASGTAFFDVWEPQMKAAALTGQVSGQGETLAIPIKVRDQVIGVIDGRKPGDMAWTTDEITMLQTLTEQMATALENARLYDSAQQATALMGERVKELDCLNDIGRRIEESPSLSDFLNWTAGRLAAALYQPEQVKIAIEFEEQVYGDAPAIEMPYRIMRDLRIGGALVGRMYVAYPEAQDLVDEESALLGDVARRLSGYIESQQLLAETQARAEEMAVLYELGQVLTTRLEVDQVLQDVYQGVARTMDATNFYVALYDAAKDEISFPLAIENQQHRTWGTRRSGSGMTEYVIRTRQPCLMRGSIEEQAERFPGVQQIGMVANSWLGAPMSIGDQVIGVIAVQSEVSETVYDERDRDMLSAIAAQTAIVIQNVRLYEQARLRAEELVVLNELSQALASRLDMQDVLQETYRQVSRLMDTTNFSIGLYYPERGQVDFEFDISISQADKDVLAAIPVEQGLTGYIVRNRQSVLFADNVRQGYSDLGIDVLGEPSESWLGVPIMMGERVLGVMIVQSYDTPRLYGEHERDLLNAISGPTAIAIQNARLVEQMRQRAERERLAREITAEMRRSLDVTTVLQTALHQLRTSLGLTEAEVWIEETSSETPAVSLPLGGIIGGE
jgi:GAF domain-containing protein